MNKKLLRKILISVVILTLLVFAYNNYADTVNIYCPYCDNEGVEILNDNDGICKCNNCDRLMLILNGTLYTDEKQELSLADYIIYSESGSTFEDNTEDTSEKEDNILLDNSQSTENDADTKHYGIEPEEDSSENDYDDDTKSEEKVKEEKEEKDEVYEKDKEIGTKGNIVSSISNIDNKVNVTSKSNVVVATKSEIDIQSVLEYFTEIKSTHYLIIITH